MNVDCITLFGNFIRIDYVHLVTYSYVFSAIFYIICSVSVVLKLNVHFFYFINYG